MHSKIEKFAQAMQKEIDDNSHKGDWETFLHLNKLETILLDQLGKARTVTVTNKQTTIIDGKGEEKDILAKVEEIKQQIEKADSNYEIEKLQQRR